MIYGYAKPNAQTLDESLYGNDYFCHSEGAHSFHIGELITIVHIIYNIAPYYTIQV